MLLNYFKTAIRALWNNKLYTFINIFGLAIGTSCCLLILLYVYHELSYDRFHEKADRIYRAWVLEEYGNDEQFLNTVTPIALGPAIESEVPEAEFVVKLGTYNWTAKSRDANFTETIHMVSPAFFKVFDFEILSGSVIGVLDEAKNIVLTEKLATKYFGQNNPINQVISFRLDDQTLDFTVRAVVKNPPANSSIQFGMLISTENQPLIDGPFSFNGWFILQNETYVLLREGTTSENLKEKFRALVSKHVDMDEGGTYTIGLQQLTDIHLNTEFPKGFAEVSDPKYSYILGGIAFLVLLIASINFITLSVSSSMGRAREVGVRKSIGAVRAQIVIQFLGEATLTVFFGLFVGLGLAQLFLNEFNDLANTRLSISFTPFLFAVFFGLLVVIGVLAGFYPSIIISRFSPALILKSGNKNSIGNNNIRRILIALQFVLSIGLIGATLIMDKQLSFLRAKDLGFTKENIISVQLPSTGNRLMETITGGLKLSDQYQIALKKFPGIVSTAGTSQNFSNNGWMKISFRDAKDNFQEYNLNIVSPEYISTMGIRMIAGRDFQKDNVSDFRRSIIVNKAFVEAFQIEDLNNARMPDPTLGDHEIIGITDDFNYASLHGVVQPLVLALSMDVVFAGSQNINIYSDPAPKLFVRYERGSEKEVVRILENLWKEISGDEEFNYEFVAQSIDAMYEHEKNLGKIVTIATFFAIFVASLGLFALSSINIQNRMKEFSIRKILGASESSIIYLVSREYLIMVLITALITTPVAWYFMNNWLSGFAYRIQINFIYFFVAGLVAVTMTLISISFHMYRVIKMQPVENLRYE